MTGLTDAVAVRYPVERLWPQPQRPNEYAPAGSDVYGDCHRVPRRGAADSRVPAAGRTSDESTKDQDHRCRSRLEDPRGARDDADCSRCEPPTNVRRSASRSRNSRSSKSCWRRSSSSRPVPAGGVYMAEQNRIMFPPVDNPLRQPYGAFSQSELLTILIENLVGKYLGGKALNAVSKRSATSAEAAARDEVRSAIAQYCGSAAQRRRRHPDLRYSGSMTASAFGLALAMICRRRRRVVRPGSGARSDARSHARGAGQEAAAADAGRTGSRTSRSTSKPSTRCTTSSKSRPGSSIPSAGSRRASGSTC